jgi:hypothetical protein
MNEDRMKNTFLNISMIFCLLVSTLLVVCPAQAEGEPLVPLDGFWNDPADPSIYDFITFGLYGYAPYDWVCEWRFGDGTTDNNCFVDHSKRYQADGDYFVSVDVRIPGEAEVYTTSRVLSIRTHDVAITRLAVPQSARAGQTRQLEVGVRNNLYPERVRVELYKSTPTGYESQPFGTLEQYVPPRAQNRTTTFTFNYTFTAEDARSGKISFKAVATLLDSCDALIADNLAISLPTRVTP